MGDKQILFVEDKPQQRDLFKTVVDEWNHEHEAEGRRFVVQTRDEQLVPERVELAAAAVEELGEVAVEVGGGEAGLVGRGVGLVEGEVGEVAVEVLHVRDVAAEADDGLVLEGAEALDVGEAGEGAVGCCLEEVLAFCRR